MTNEMLKKRRAFIGAYYMPQPDLDSVSRRLWHFIEFLLEADWEVAIGYKNDTNVGTYGTHLRELGVPTYSLLQSDIADIARMHDFDVALLAFWHVAEPLIPVFRELSPKTKIVVDSTDLHFVRHARRTFSPQVKGRTSSLLDETYADELVRELNVYSAADLIFTVSEKEAHLLDDLLGQNSATKVPDHEQLDRSPIPFDDRQGIVFIGNFEHPPNAEGIRFLCQEVVPLLPPGTLQKHPLYIVGNDLRDELRALGEGLPGVNMVGWVPSVLPYLERARLSVLPLLFGAGTKRKMIMTLSLGTPAVSTTIGIEGLDLVHEDQILVADNPADFATSIVRLLTDRELWHHLADAGLERITVGNGRDHGRDQFLAGIDMVLKRTAKPLPEGAREWSRWQRTKLADHDYRRLTGKIRKLIDQNLPAEATIAIISRGDEELMRLGSRAGRHFPADERGGYIGYHPADGASAIELLEKARVDGVEFLLIPSTAMWWLDHYTGFREHMEGRYELAALDTEVAVIFDLRTVREGAAAYTPAPVAAAAEAPSVQLVRTPKVSVVIPTFNRAAYLRPSLQSLVNDVLGTEHFEVVVVDDGSTDNTEEVCREFATRMPLQYVRQDHGGISVAKNNGLHASSAPVIVWFDDDDVAAGDLLARHTALHGAHPDPSLAVLGYTIWAPWLEVTEVMRFATGAGGYLFCYDRIEDGQILDFGYFWGGRSSCKRDFLIEHGVFRPEFNFGSEDMELGFRLSKVGLKVLYDRHTIQYMQRPLTFDDICRRCERQGRSLWMFSEMHDDPAIRDYCSLDGAFERWERVKDELPLRVEAARRLEAEIAAAAPAARDALRQELYSHYWFAFDNFKLKGLVETARAGDAPRNGPA